MRRNALSLTLLVVLALSGAQASCPDGALTVDDVCFFTSDDTYTWDDAANFCRRNAAELAVVNSTAQMEALISDLLDKTVFVGAAVRDRTETVELILKSDGYPGYTNFGKYPFDLNHCIIASEPMNYTWTDVSCKHTHYALCAAPAN